MKLLVTGGAGFIVSHFILDALRKNIQIASIDNFSNSEELHGFALLKSKARRKNIISSEVDEIKGIGVKNKKILLRHFGGIDSLRKASLDQIKSKKELAQRELN